MSLFHTALVLVLVLVFHNSMCQEALADDGDSAETEAVTEAVTDADTSAETSAETEAEAVPVVPCPARCNDCKDGTANCSFASLNAPPRAFPANTRVLNMEGNYIRILGIRSFNDLPSVEVLKISRNKVTALRNDAFRSLPNLVTLDLTGNRIHRINRASLRRMDKLRTLTLNRNRIKTMAAIFEHVPNLYQLNLAKNRLKEIKEDDLSALKKVHYLDFRDNQISTIHSKAFKELTILRYLFLNNNPLVALPAMEWSTNVLQLVDFSRCKLEYVPQPMPASVGDLRLGSNKLSQINHTDFISIEALQVLALNDNELQFIADGTFSHLTELQEIWLRSNKLVYIPRNLPDNLRRLQMDDNSIQVIEDLLFSNESRLDYVTVEGNQISHIAPGTFNGLRFLNTLNFQGNKIQYLEPHTFSDLGSLSTLSLSNNPMQRIEEEAFHHLANLSTLQMSHMTEENFTLDADFLPHTLRLRMLGLMNSPGLAKALMEIIDDQEKSRVILSNMTHLDLSYNNLPRISPRVRVVFPNVKTLSIDGNAFVCDQRLKWLGEWMNSNDTINFFNYEEPVCDYPYRLSGKLVREVADDEWADEDEVNAGSFQDYQPSAGGGLDELQADAAPPAELDNRMFEDIFNVAKIKEKTEEEEKKRKNKKGKGRKRDDQNKRQKKDRKRNKDRKRKNKRGKGKRSRRDAEVFVGDDGSPMAAAK